MLPLQSLQTLSQHHAQFSLLPLCAFLDSQHLFNIKIWFSILDKDAPLTYDMCYFQSCYVF